jgi:hypothetical protein
MTRQQTKQRANLVISLFAKTKEPTFSEVQQNLLKRFGHSMSYALIARYRDAVRSQQRLGTQESTSLVAVSHAKLPDGQPVVTVTSPGSTVALPEDIACGLRYLATYAQRQTHANGMIQIDASKPGDASMSYIWGEGGDADEKVASEPPAATESGAH